MKNSIVFVVRADGEITKTNFADLVWSSAKQTTTPMGVGNADYYEPAIYFEFDGTEYATRKEADEARADTIADRAIGDDDREVDDVTELQRYECRTWGGGKSKIVRVVDAEEDAQNWLWECALVDFERDDQSPAYFGTPEEAARFVTTTSSI